LGVYGASKLAGERRVREVLGNDALILRTAWVYAAVGANFVKTMLKLMRERGSVKVVSDQVGSPTWAASVATAIWAAVHQPDIGGTRHWTDAGVASWYDFALAIAEEAAGAGLLPHTAEVLPIGTADYPTAARRPAYSVLACAETARALGLQQIHWRVNLRKMLMELQNA
jgi:dTDP-4-dehydrorhamnose reductase